MNSIAALASPLATTRSRGRPRGSRQAVARDGHLLGLHHFAFLRAVAQGVPPERAAFQYLSADCDRIDPRTAKAMHRKLLQQVITAASVIGSEELSAKARELASVVTNPISEVSVAVPALEDFAAQFDPDMYTERELQELFEEEFGKAVRQQAQATNTLTRQLRVLDELQNHLASVPKANDPTIHWFDDRLCQQLRTVGILTLQDCITFANGRGRTWHRCIEGLGLNRAQRLTRWLSSHPELGRLSSRVLGIGRTTTPPVEAVTLTTELAPIALQDLGPKLDGTMGLMRASGFNALGASNDLQALEAWAKTLELKSIHTQSAYLREAQRFVLWAVREQGKSLSSLQAADCVAYQAFLLDPPPHWINPLPTAQSAPDWRPLRGPLSHRSAQRAMATIARLYADLVSLGYLAFNPMPRALLARPTQVQLDTSRSLVREDLELVKLAVGQLPECPQTRRLEALLSLYLNSGVRRDEVVRGMWSHVKEVREDGIAASTVALSVIGKGNKERIIPLRSDTLTCLRAHLVDRQQLGMIQTLEAAPLIGVLEGKVGGSTASAPGALRDGGYDQLRRFFRQAARLAGSSSQREAFEKATVHWLRHTFAHRVLYATGENLRVAQQLLGHASINTTGIYIKASLLERVDAIEMLDVI